MSDEQSVLAEQLCGRLKASRDPYDEELFRESIHLAGCVGISYREIATEFEFAEPLVSRWAIGDSTPAPPVRADVLDWLGSRVENLLRQKPRSAALA